jgi:precorrin-6A/cobalt-precorrin-6A reductase
MRILILGGTEEARLLAERLDAMGHAVISSLAGVTSTPLMPVVETRVGGFGGIEGLTTYLIRTRIERIVDATHPYAARIKTNAVLASEATGIRLVRYSRPEWQEPPGIDWIRATDGAEAASLLPAGARALLTTGHTEIESFFARTDCSFVVRTIEPLTHRLPINAISILSRPPYFLSAELDLMTHQGISHLVSKNSGGVQTAAKLDAAAELGIAVVMIDRPRLLPAPEAPTLGQVIAALRLDRP